MGVYTQDAITFGAATPVALDGGTVIGPLTVTGATGITGATTITGAVGLNQSNAALGAVGVTITQSDTDQPFVDFVGTSAASSGASLSSWTTGGAINGFVQVKINGTAKWMPYYTAPTS